MHEILTSGFLFPNEIEVHWSLMIVLYPYITGLVAGAFIVSSLYHVFGKEELKLHWRDCCQSPLKGPAGNVEYLALWSTGPR